MSRRWVIVGVLAGLELLALALAFWAFMVSVVSAFLPHVDAFVRWLMALIS